MLPAELQTPAAWDRYLANLTEALAQVASQLPLLHTVQPPASASSLNQAITEVELALRSFTMALLEYTSERLRCAKLAATGSEHLLFPRLQLLLYTAFSTGAVPQSWITSLVTPIFKEDATDTANYRPIALGEPLSRLYASILVQRLGKCKNQHNFEVSYSGRLQTRPQHQPPSICSTACH